MKGIAILPFRVPLILWIVVYPTTVTLRFVLAVAPQRNLLRGFLAATVRPPGGVRSELPEASDPTLRLLKDKGGSGGGNKGGGNKGGGGGSKHKPSESKPSNRKSEGGKPKPPSTRKPKPSHNPPTRNPRPAPTKNPKPPPRSSSKSKPTPAKPKRNPSSRLPSSKSQSSSVKNQPKPSTKSSLTSESKGDLQGSSNSSNSNKNRPVPPGGNKAKVSHKESGGTSAQTEVPTLSTSESLETLYVHVGGDYDDDSDSTEAPTFSTTELRGEDLEVIYVYVYLNEDDDGGSSTEPPTIVMTTSKDGGTTVPIDEFQMASTSVPERPFKGLNEDSTKTSEPPPRFTFDRTKFVTVEQLPTLAFRIQINEFAPLQKKRKLKVYFQGFLEDVLGMESNQNWYPFHSKSIGEISMEFLPVWYGDKTTIKERNVEPKNSGKAVVLLLLNAFVFVHINDQITVDQTATKMTTGFRDAFDHSLNLYFAFWGFGNLQTVLEATGGLQNPVLESVRVGNTTVMTMDSGGNLIANAIAGSSSVKGFEHISFWTMFTMLACSTLGTL